MGPVARELVRVVVGALVYAFLLAVTFLDDTAFTIVGLSGPVLLTWGIFRIWRASAR
jgi:hypothetical protein